MTPKKVELASLGSSDYDLGSEVVRALMWWEMEEKWLEVMLR